MYLYICKHYPLEAQLPYYEQKLELLHCDFLINTPGNKMRHSGTDAGTQAPVSTESPEALANRRFENLGENTLCYHTYVM